MKPHIFYVVSFWVPRETPALCPIKLATCTMAQRQQLKNVGHRMRGTVREKLHKMQYCHYVLEILECYIKPENQIKTYVDHEQKFDIYYRKGVYQLMQACTLVHLNLSSIEKILASLPVNYTSATGHYYHIKSIWSLKLQRALRLTFIWRVPYSVSKPTMPYKKGQ